MIEALDIYNYELPWPATPPVGASAKRCGYLIRARTGNKQEGWGEAASWSGPNHNPAEIDHCLRHVLTLEHAKQVSDCLAQTPTLSGATSSLPSPVQFALECAVLDLAANAKQQNVAALLQRAARPSVSNSCLIWDEEIAATLLARGNRQFKVKIHSEDRRGLELLLRVFERSDGTARFRVDGNGTWTQKTAADILAAIPRQALIWVEQPMAPGSESDIRWLRQTYDVPVAFDESVRQANSLAALLAKGGVDVVTLKPMFIGGFFRALELAETARGQGVAVCVTHVMDTTVGRLAALQLAAIVGADNMPSGIETDGLVDICRRPEQLGDMVVVPREPGFGIRDLDPRKFAHIRTAQ